MLRKTYTHKCKAAFDGRSDIAKRFTRHKTEEVLEGLYDGVTREEGPTKLNRIRRCTRLC